MKMISSLYATFQRLFPVILGMRASLLAVVMVLLCICARSSATGLSYTLNGNGLATLEYDSQSVFYLWYAGYMQNSVPVFIDGNGQEYQGAYTPTYSMNYGTQTLTLTYSWGTATCVYAQAGDALNMTMTVHNTSGDMLKEIWMRPMILNLPNAVGHVVDYTKVMNGAVFEAPLSKRPMVVLANYTTGSVAFCCADVTENPTENAMIKITHGSGQHYLTNKISYVGSGQSKTLPYSLRFGPAGCTIADLAPDVLAAYRSVNPMKLNWPDRRPIGRIFLAGMTTPVPPNNPRRFFAYDPNINVFTTEGLEYFRTKMLTIADGIITTTAYHNAQGIVVWDIDGQAVGPIYYGDPTKIATLAPEMEYQGGHDAKIVDEFFAKLTEAGLRVGVCIRSQILTWNEQGQIWQQVEPVDEQEVIDTLDAKISYAKNRWGCTLFYIDSIANSGKATSQTLKVLQEAYPDILLIPEQEVALDHAYSAPYKDLWINELPDPGLFELYNRAFSNIVVNTDPTPYYDTLVAAVSHGDILWNDMLSINYKADIINAIYEEASWPANIPDGALWLDASAIPDVADGDRVNIWEDYFGHDMCSLYQRYGNGQNRSPRYIESELNGYPVIRFDPNEADGDGRDFLFGCNATYGGHVFNGLNLQVPMTMFYVYRRQALPSIATYWSFTSNQFSSIYGSRLQSDTSPYPMWFGFSAVTNAWSVECVILTGTDNTSVVRRDGLTIDGTALSGVSSISLGELCLGGKANGGTCGAVDYAEIIIYNRALTSEEEANVGRYLAGKYGLGTAY